MAIQIRDGFPYPGLEIGDFIQYIDNITGLKRWGKVVKFTHEDVTINKENVKTCYILVADKNPDENIQIDEDDESIKYCKCILSCYRDIPLS
jgi:hypothetical protein